MAEENVPVRHASLFYKGKRVAWMQTADYEILTGDTQEITDGGDYFTDGATVSTLSCSALVPVPGVGLSVVEDALTHKTVDVAVALINGKIHQLKARAKSLKFTTDVAAGKLTGTFEWMCSKPKPT